ncbi:MAG: threonylcarbamoyl-AMP synthase [Treponema sp.]|jgi:L-threonylcarbamoyladenylate synthase|nr:threonylcarbamoyl-AMP synthase [Treponema sp.]
MKMLTTSKSDIALAAAALAGGALVAFPTETVYGLGGDAFSGSALARIFDAKKRPRFDPLIIHIADLSTLDKIVLWEALDNNARKKLDLLAEKLWPGPLTFILPKRPEVPGLATAGLSTAAVRFPSHPVAQNLIRLFQGAAAAPSANLFGCLSPTKAEHVREQLGDKVDYIIDGGRTNLGVESTVLDLCAPLPTILRPGGCPREEIEAVIGTVGTGPVPSGPAAAAAGGQPSPGMLKSHYAPLTTLVLHPAGKLRDIPEKKDEGKLYFKTPAGKTPLSENTRILSASGDTVEAAANLFEMLHQLDSLGLRLIHAEETPQDGLGEAINDRLRRASVSRTPLPECALAGKDTGQFRPGR